MTGKRRTPFFDDWYRVKQAYMARNPKTNCTFAMPQDSTMLANLVQRWKESGQASFLDVAIQFCDDKDLPVLDELRTYLAEAAKQRNPYEGTKAQKEGYKDKAFTLIVQLINANATLSEAAGKAAAWLNDSGFEYKASTLEKQYTEVMRSGDEPLETTMLEAWKEMGGREMKEAHIQLRKRLRGPKEEEIGNRRQ